MICALTPDDLDDDFHTDMSSLDLLGTLDPFHQSQDRSKYLLLQIVDAFLDALLFGKECREDRHEGGNQRRIARHRLPIARFNENGEISNCLLDLAGTLTIRYQPALYSLLGCRVAYLPSCFCFFGCVVVSDKGLDRSSMTSIRLVTSRLNRLSAALMTVA